MGTVKERLTALRAELKGRGLMAIVVPLTDEHQSEYVPDYAQRLAWISGFKGSAGIAIVTDKKAAIFVDGRYTIQVREQVDGDHYTYHHLIDEPPVDWLAGEVRPGDRVGYDPFLHIIGWVAKASTTLGGAGAELVALDDNPIDAVWHDQPLQPLNEARPHDTKYAGISSTDRRAALGKEIDAAGADAAVLSQLDSIAWLFNIRGSDVPNTPVACAFAVLDADGAAQLFINPAKVTANLRSHLGNGVEVRGRDEFLTGLDELGLAGRRVLADPATASAAIFDRLTASGAEIVKGADPCALPKARKNEVELNGTRAAHIRDGAAVTRFLHWLAIEAPKGELTEISAADRLRAFREAGGELMDLSFRTISAAGPNGALCHYSVSAETNRGIELDSVYLVDSGGQYLDGTTDITRTIAVGDPGNEARENFTRVLQGHIALATAVFPTGTTGPQLDTIARMPLWRVGLDYDHGTGHGVGVYLAVHEGPGRIAKVPNRVALEPGMIYSNEPGYYKAGEYGMRMENLVIVERRDVGGERDMLGFETITLAPIDRNMIVADMLSREERDWLNQYHARVLAKIGPLLEGAARDWLEGETSEV